MNILSTLNTNLLETSISFVCYNDSHHIKGYNTYKDSILSLDVSGPVIPVS